MKVYLKKSDVREPIGAAKSREEAFLLIESFLTEHNYKASYYRSWTEENGETVIDVGSWSEFFIIAD